MSGRSALSKRSQCLDRSPPSRVRLEPQCCRRPTMRSSVNAAAGFGLLAGEGLTGVGERGSRTVEDAERRYARLSPSPSDAFLFTPRIFIAASPTCRATSAHAD